MHSSVSVFRNNTFHRSNIQEILAMTYVYWTRKRSEIFEDFIPCDSWQSSFEKPQKSDRENVKKRINYGDSGGWRRLTRLRKSFMKPRLLVYTAHWEDTFFERNNSRRKMSKWARGIFRIGREREMGNRVIRSGEVCHLWRRSSFDAIFASLFENVTAYRFPVWERKCWKTVLKELKASNLTLVAYFLGKEWDLGLGRSISSCKARKMMPLIRKNRKKNICAEFSLKLCC